MIAAATSEQRPCDQTEMSLGIRRQSLELGFHKVGIVSADALTEESERLRQWLAHGFHGEMTWMERDPAQRTDPRRIFPAARSVIVGALNYYTPRQHQVRTTRVSGWTQEQPVATGKVSRYAWGDDYHDVVGDKLRALLKWIQSRWPEAEGKVCVDIQPTMDKAWAVHAGLGWMGKHTNLITRDYGSWVFIGELLLNVELEYDREEVADQCGSCTLCLDECPTGAIVQPYVLDSNKCISHATIESRAAKMRAEVAANLEGWFYGCDICQEVCPWNQKTPATDETHLEPRPGNVDVSLPEVLELTPETYAARFRGSAMKRAKLSGLQRNARALHKRSQ